MAFGISVSSVTHSRSAPRPFWHRLGGLPTRTITTSADFSLRHSRRPFRRKARSPRVRTHSFAAQPPDLRRLALITRASRFHARSPCSATPSIRFLFIGSQLRFPFPHSVALMQLRFASFAVINSREDLYLQCAPVPGAPKTTKPAPAGFVAEVERSLRQMGIRRPMNAIEDEFARLLVAIEVRDVAFL